eukprot:CAMPEP_0183704628 /NCGR_PEP_ID=MMETSP0737-20130205/1915_1 /TAXON_ID=385413 /ORGANISM="Thalassiosira miniscula, Strain CCMP1093" /LENGTH=295 /DNA_ID=CAMNT_0025931549 /DNA_START=79 /DNA_END=966 /DNA_ORIENTATION=-
MGSGGDSISSLSLPSQQRRRALTRRRECARRCRTFVATTLVVLTLTVMVLFEGDRDAFLSFLQEKNTWLYEFENFWDARRSNNGDLVNTGRRASLEDANEFKSDRQLKEQLWQERQRRVEEHQQEVEAIKAKRREREIQRDNRERKLQNAIERKRREEEIEKAKLAMQQAREGREEALAARELRFQERKEREEARALREQMEKEEEKTGVKDPLGMAQMGREERNRILQQIERERREALGNDGEAQTAIEAEEDATAGGGEPDRMLRGSAQQVDTLDAKREAWVQSAGPEENEQR